MAVLSSIATRGATKVNGIYYNFNGSEASVERNNTDKYSGDIVVPSYVTYNNKTYTVTSVGWLAFYQCYELTSVSLPSTIKKFDSQIFRDCWKLKSVNIPESITKLDLYTFENCYSLEKIQLPKNLVEIGTGAFENCSSLTDIIIPKTVTRISSDAFEGCSSLQSIVVESGNTVYDSRNNCNAIISTSNNQLLQGCNNSFIPEGVTYIYYNAFKGMAGLKAIHIPASVETIGNQAFVGCSSLNTITVETSNPNYDSRNNCNAIIRTSTNELIFGCQNTTIPSDVTSIGYAAFYECKSLKEIDLGSITNIGYNAFYGCTGITSLHIPSSVTSIEGSAFYGCTGLTTLYIPANVTSIANGAFGGCFNLESIVVEDGNANYSSPNHCNAIIETSTKTLVAGCNNTIIPADIKTIGASAFEGCNSIKSQIIPSEVTTIGYKAFMGCNGLTDVVLPSTVVSIGSNAFSGCANLKTIIIPPRVTILGGLPKDCPQLTDVYLYPEVVPYTSGESGGMPISYELEPFMSTTNATLHVISSVINSYNDFIWEEDQRARIVPIVGKAPDEGSLLYYFDQNRKNAILIGYQDEAEKTSYWQIPDTIKKDGISYTVTDINYSGYPELKAVSIPSTITRISTSAFTKCTNLEKVIVANLGAWCRITHNYNGVLNIAGHLYADENTEITSLIIPDGITQILNYTFKGCKSITSVSIPTGVESIGYSAFENCTSLSSVTIPNDVTNIESDVFKGCTSLPIENGIRYAGNLLCEVVDKSSSSYSIKAGTRWIANNAFQNCTNLSAIAIPEGVSYIQSSAFRDCTNLKSVIIPRSAREIGSSQFYNCKNLQMIECKADTTALSEYTFSGVGTATSPVRLIVPEKYLEHYQSCVKNDRLAGGYFILEGVEDHTLAYSFDYENMTVTVVGFEEGQDVADVEIPETVSYDGYTFNVTSIGNSAFRETILSSIVIPECVTSIGSGAFANCLDLKTVNLPKNLTKIEGLLFEYCSSLDKIIIPDGVTEIGWGAFRNCKNLKSIVIPNSVTTIGVIAFNNAGLTSIVLPNKLTTIEQWTFGNCNKLERIDIPKNVKNIQSGAFYGCTGLKDLFCYALNPPVVESESAFNEVSATLHVPNSALDAYQTASVWSQFENIVGFDVEPVVETTFVEYFIDNDPGLGKATQVEVEVDENGAADFEVPGTALHYGLNLVGIRLMTVFDDGTVSYSPTTLHSVYKYHAQDAQTVGIEYFVNKDPGVGKATRVNLTGESVTFDLPVAQLEVGINVLGLRAISINSETGVTYGATTYQYVYRSASTGNKPIERIEYFWDEDPGQGNATPLAFTMVGDSAVVDCNINHEGIYGEHVLSVRALAGGVWSPLYQQMVILPNLSPLDGLISLDPDNEEDIETGLFQTLPSLIGALSTRGFNIGVDIHVADANYVFMVSEESLYFVQALYEYMLETNFYLNMKADHQATFNFILPEEFIYIHQNELPSIVASVQAMFSHVVTENISILINGQAYQYDGFQVEPNDLMALKNIYNRLNGKNWTDKKWSFQSNGRDKKELPGVGFNDAGRVTSIELNTNNLKGVLGNDWALMLPYLTYLNMSYNDIEGDLSPWLKETTSLKSLYMANNCLTEISETLPSSVSSIDLRYQFFIRDAVGNLVVNDEAIARQKPVLLYISNKQQVALPSLFTYNHKYKDHSYSPTMYIYDDKMVNIALNSSQNGFVWLSGEDYKAEQDARYIVTMYTENIGGYYPVKLRYVMGDANMSGATDVLDVQLTLNRILSSAAQFNYSAANTYTDDKINVQDIVCTVNIVLAQEQGTVAGSRGEQAAVMPEAWLYTENGRLLIASATEMGAIDVELAGVSTSQVSLLLNHKQFQMIGRNTEQGSRYVIFSPIGQAIPAGEATALLKISASAEPVAVLASDIDAQAVSVALNQHPTSIAQLRQGSLKAHFDGDQLVVAASAQQENVSLRLLSANGTLIMKSQMDVVDRSGRRVNAHVPSGVYLLEMTTANGNTKVVKLMKR